MANEQLILLKTQVDERVESIDRKRIEYRNKATRAHIGTAVLAGMSSILLGLHIDGLAEPIRITVLVITTIIAIYNTYNSFFNFKELWVANNEALNRLYALKFNVEFFETGSVEITDQILEQFKSEYQSSLNELNKVWHNNRIDGSKVK